MPDETVNDQMIAELAFDDDFKFWVDYIDIMMSDRFDREVEEMLKLKED